MCVKETFPKRLKILREKIGISQGDFAKALGVSRSTISYYETGERLPDIEMLDRICETTGCSANFLLGKSQGMVDEFADIGEVTGLSDKSIKILDRLSAEGLESTVNFLIESDNFREILCMLNVYSEYAHDEIANTVYRHPPQGYAKYWLKNEWEKIIEGYSDKLLSNPKCRNFSVKYAKEDLIREYDEITKAFEKHQKELQDFRDEMARKSEEDFIGCREEHEENMRNDPIYRFKYSLERNCE